MLGTIAWVLGILVVLIAIDRVLLRLEARGWINYRRRGLSRSGAAFHTLTLQSIFDPAAEQLKQAQYHQIEERDDSGDPPPDDPPDDPILPT